MRTLSATQQALVDGAYKKEISWLFTVVTVSAVTYRWSTKSKSFGGNTYSAKILPESFQGVTLNRAKSELRIQAPNELTFSVTNSGSTLTASDFAGATVTVNLVMSNATYADTSVMTWKFRVKDGARGCRAAYQMLYFACEDFLQQYLRGTYPKGKKTRALSDSRTATPKDKACVPVIFGTAYVPIRSAYLNADAKRYYVMGPSGPTYTVSEAASPKEWKNQSTWASASYTFTQNTKTLKGTSYRVVEPIIADSDGDAVVDACGLWKDGDYFLDMACKFSRSDTSSLTSPEEIIEYLLEDFGVPSADIDTGAGSSFATAATTFAGWSLTLNGGLWKKELKTVILSRVLSMCHAVLDVEDKIKLRILSKTSRRTVTSAMISKKADAGEGTFSTSPLTPSGQDSGYILHCESGKPQDRPQEILVSALSAGTTANISDETLDLSWVLDTQRAQCLGTLFFQRLLRKDSALSFEGHATLTDLQPDDVISFSDTNYGGSYSALIDRITLLREGGVQIEAIRFSETLLDYSDLSPVAVTYVDDTTRFWRQDVPYVTVSPIAGEAMFTTIEACLANMPSWARRIVLLRGTHPAPTLTNTYVLPTDRDIEIVGSAGDEVVVLNNPTYNCFEIIDSDRHYKFSNFRIASQNAGVSASYMIFIKGTTAADNLSRVMVDGLDFQLVKQNDIGVRAESGQGVLKVRDCKATGGATGTGWFVSAVAYENVRVKNNQADLMYVGIIAYECNTVWITDNSMTDFRYYGIYVGGTSATNDRIHVNGNTARSGITLFEAEWGIHIQKAENYECMANVVWISASTGASKWGIGLATSNSGIASNNKIFLYNAADPSNNFGMILSVADRNVVQGNVIDMVANRNTATAKDYAIILDSSSDNNQGTDNITYRAGIDLSDSGSGNAITYQAV